MKLKSIPKNTVVHTPTEEEAKELLAILHENGYEWYHKNAPIPNPRLEKIAYINIYNSLNGCRNVITYCDKHTYVERYITLAEFKDRYVLNEDNFTKSEEKPQSKFKVGDLVIFPNRDNPMCIDDIEDGVAMSWWHDGGIKAAACLDDLKPYTEPETKPVEDMETKEKEQGEKGNNSENSQSDNDLQHNWDSLDEQAKEYIIGQYQHGFEGMNTLESEKELMSDDEYEWHKQYWGGWIEAMINTFPESEMKRVNWMCITAWIGGEDIEEECDNPIDTNKIYFRTTADRDKCIEEIKAIIEKYSEK